MNATEWLFWLGVGWLIYVPIGYPLALWLLSRRLRFRPEVSDLYEPSVSVLIAARNEEKDIGWKIEETLAWNYPADRLELLIGSDASSDKTDDVIGSVRDARLRFVRNEERSGKGRTLNRLARMASGEVFFFTDANTHVDKQALKKMTRHLSDQRIGCVTGLERNASEGASAITIGSNAFLGYEAEIDKLESRLGSVLVCDGSIYCLRRSHFSNLDPDLANDLEHPVRVGAAGAKIVFEPRARSFEHCTISAREEFARRRRIAGQGTLATWRLRHQLKGIRLWQFFSRKVLRWLMPLPLAFIFVSTFILRHEPCFMWLFLAQALFYLMGIAGAWLEGDSRMHAVLRLPFIVLMSIVAVFFGFMDACCGKTFATWNIAGLSRGKGRGSA